MTTTDNSRDVRQLAWGSAIVGFALGGFFDGIMLHQVLQWHHLFSLVPGETWRDIRMQILMDGWFHVLHYVIACAGLWLIWRGRGGVARMGADRRLLAAALLGFSVWQFVDVVLFHWILMIHRIRVDVPAPLAYDLGWLIAFGVTTLVAGLWVSRHPGSGTGGGRAAAGLAVAAMLMGPVAAMPGAGATLVVLREGADPARIFSAVPDSRLLWSNSDGTVLAITTPAQPWLSTLRLYNEGALAVGSTPILGGCLGWGI